MRTPAEAVAWFYKQEIFSPVSDEQAFSVVDFVLLTVRQEERY
jgi:hypothetical protein